MEVTFWVDKKTYQWPRVEAEVRTPVSLYGMIGKVNPGTKFVLEQEPVLSNLWLPKRFHMQVNATALGFISEDSSTEETYSNYRPIGQEAAASSTSTRAPRASLPLNNSASGHIRTMPTGARYALHRLS